MLDTITVQGYFGKDKQVNRDEYIKEWRDHAMQLHRITYEEPEAITRIVDEVVEMAGREFDRILDRLIAKEEQVALEY